MDSFEKQSYEEFTIAGDFSLNFADGETISSQTVTAVDQADVDATADVIDDSSITNDGGARVLVKVVGGDEADSPYKITMRCETSAGHKWELDVRMNVVEV